MRTTTTTEPVKKPTTQIEIPPKPQEVEYIPFGSSDKIRLSIEIVRKLVAVPTWKGNLPTDKDCLKFMMLCRGKRANPFEGDCWMIGYETKDGPKFSLVCGIDLFLKRAEQSENYAGRESGIIVRRGEDVIEIQGSFMREDDVLLGGWAKVYRKDRSYPDYKAVRLSTYNTGKSRWEHDPAGMIEKVPLSQALRSAYPTALGGMYTPEEMDRIGLSVADLGALAEQQGSDGDGLPVGRQKVGAARNTTHADEHPQQQELSEEERKKAWADVVAGSEGSTTKSTTETPTEAAPADPDPQEAPPPMAEEPPAGEEEGVDDALEAIVSMVPGIKSDLLVTAVSSFRDKEKQNRVVIGKPLGQLTGKWRNTTHGKLKKLYELLVTGECKPEPGSVMTAARKIAGIA